MFIIVLVIWVKLIKRIKLTQKQYDLGRKDNEELKNMIVHKQMKNLNKFLVGEGSTEDMGAVMSENDIPDDLSSIIDNFDTVDDDIEKLDDKEMMLISDKAMEDEEDFDDLLSNINKE